MPLEDAMLCFLCLSVPSRPLEMLKETAMAITVLDLTLLRYNVIIIIIIFFIITKSLLLDLTLLRYNVIIIIIILYVIIKYSMSPYLFARDCIVTNTVVRKELDTKCLHAYT